MVRCLQQPPRSVILVWNSQRFYHRPARPKAVSSRPNHRMCSSIRTVRLPKTMSSPRWKIFWTKISEWAPRTFWVTIRTKTNIFLNIARYTIYELSPQDAQNGIWLENTTLLVVCGSVSRAVGSLFAEYFLRGGKMLCICSDVLHIVLPSYRTAEVRENELVQFSYGQWQKIKLMHHIFCYQPSPIKKNFSTDSDDPPPTMQRKP